MAIMLTSTWQPLAASLAGFGTGKSLALELPTPATCILAMFHCQPQRAPFSVRRLWSKIGISASPAASLLRGPTVFERFRCRPRSSWATPRQPVRCSRPDTSCSLARADGVLLERAAGPLSVVLRLWPWLRRLSTPTPRDAHGFQRACGRWWSR